MQDIIETVESTYMFLRESVCNCQPIVVSPTDNPLVYMMVKSFKGDIPIGVNIQVSSPRDIISKEEAHRILSLKVGSLLNFVDNLKEIDV